MTIKVKDLKILLANQPDDADIYIDLQDDLEDGVWKFSVRPLEGVDYKFGHVKNGKAALRACKETSGAKKAIILL